MCLRRSLSGKAQFGIITCDFSLSLVTAKHSSALENAPNDPFKERNRD